MSCQAGCREEGRCTATWKVPRRKAGPPNHHDDIVDSDQQVVDKERSLSLESGRRSPSVPRRAGI